MHNTFDAVRWRRQLAVALKHEPADLVLSGGTIVNVFTGELEKADIAIVNGRIAGIGCYPTAHERIDLTGKIIAPSFVDAHIHLESSLVWIPEWAKAVVPHGTGAVITDPHEMANVAGLSGISAMRAAARNLPIHVHFTAPSCVPASHRESPGAIFDIAQIIEMLTWDDVIGLGELMDFPGVLSGNDDIAAKLAVSQQWLRDGHAPELRGDALQAYIGSGIWSDHESTTLDEAREKLRLGMMMMIREGSSEHNLHQLLPLITDETYPRCCFASDDRDCADLLYNGHIDATLRLAIAEGLDPVRAIRLATWNPANAWGLRDIGAIAPGYEANLVVLNDLQRVEVALAFFQGHLVAQDNVYIGTDIHHSPPPALLHTVNMAPLLLSDLRLAPEDAHVAVQIVPDQIVTRAIAVDPSLDGDWAIADPSRDLLKLVCVERHHATGRVGVGYVRGFGLQRGALASTIAHDAHNIIAVGANDMDLLGAIAVVAESQGGLAAVADGQVLSHLPLPIAGLLSDQPLPDVATSYQHLEETAHQLGSSLASPFGLLAFMALSVIPEARVTDRGFIHVGDKIHESRT